MENITSGMQLQVTANAAEVDLDVVSLQPCNWVCVYGVAGQECTASVSAGLSIVDGGGNFTIDNSGRYRFQVAYVEEMENSLEAFTVVIADEINGVLASAPVVTGGYRQNSTKHILYNHTTGAPADGIVPCSFYLKIKQDANSPVFTHIEVACDGASSIVGAPPSSPRFRSINLAKDGAVTVNVVNTKAEIVNVTIALPESPDVDVQALPVRFIAPAVQQ